MKRFALIRMRHPYAPQETLMECTRKTKAEAVKYFQNCYPSQDIDADGYMHSGDETWTVAEFFNNRATNYSPFEDTMQYHDSFA